MTIYSLSLDRHHHLPYTIIIIIIVLLRIINDMMVSHGTLFSTLFLYSRMLNDTCTQKLLFPFSACWLLKKFYVKLPIILITHTHPDPFLLLVIHTFTRTPNVSVCRLCLSFSWARLKNTPCLTHQVSLQQTILIQQNTWCLRLVFLTRRTELCCKISTQQPSSSSILGFEQNIMLIIICRGDKVKNGLCNAV